MSRGFARDRDRSIAKAKDEYGMKLNSKKSIKLQNVQI